MQMSLWAIMDIVFLINWGVSFFSSSLLLGPFGMGLKSIGEVCLS